MNWRPKFETARAELTPAPQHSRQVARQLLRNIAKLETSKTKRETRRLDRQARRAGPAW